MASNKRDFVRAFDTPGGLHVAAEPQDSPVRCIPGQWPEDIDIDIHEVAPVPGASFFTTLTRFASSITSTFCTYLPAFRRRVPYAQQIVAVPVVREDGSSKRRLIDAGLSPLTPATSSRRGRTAARSTSPKLWVTTPPTPEHCSPYNSVQHSSAQSNPVLYTPVQYNTPQHNSPGDLGDLLGDDIDDSLDWSMDDVDTSTPPPNWLRRPERRMLTPKTRVISPNSQFNILRQAPVTPMRKQLLKQQLRAVETVTTTSPILRQHDHTLASPSSPNLTISPLKKKALESSVLSINAPAIAANAQVANAQYKAELEARENQDADAQTPMRQPHLGYLDAADVYSNDFSELPNAGDLSSPFDSLLSPAAASSPFESLLSPSPRRRTVRFAAQGRVKPFYFDERVSEMLDSTLESIRSPVPKPNFHEDDEHGKSCDGFSNVPLEDPASNSDSEESVDGSSLNDSIDGPLLDDPSDDLPLEPSFNGLSLDDPLQESQLSEEFLKDVFEDELKAIIAEADALPPAPRRPLIAPLSESERAQLEDIAAKSKHGQNASYPIVPDKISARDFGTLLPSMFNGSEKAWLNDEIVNHYLSIVVKTLNDDAGFVYKKGGPAPSYHAFSSHWYNSIQSSIKKVERWAGRVGLGGKQFLDAKIVLFPICDGSHWRLIAVEPRKRTIEYFDSLGWDGSKYVQKVRDYLQHELKELYKEDEWKVLELQRSARQLNGSDCGVFVLLNALVAAWGAKASDVKACNGMLEARERLALTIMTNCAKELEY